MDECPHVSLGTCREKEKEKKEERLNLRASFGSIDFGKHGLNPRLDWSFHETILLLQIHSLSQEKIKQIKWYKIM